MQTDNQTLRRLLDLSARADLRCCYTYSEFLDAAQQSDLLGAARLFPSPFSLEGGHPSCERRIAVFGSPDTCGYEPTLPIVCVKIAPKNEKFSDELTHRDFLGALMGLGIRREVLGDIFIAEGCGYLFCLDTIAPYIADNLTQVKRTTTVCRVVEEPPLPEAKIEQQRVNVASERLDAIISAVWKMSRGDSAKLIRAQRVFVNSRLCESTSSQLSDGDTVSARGFGKFIYRGMEKETRKGRLFVIIDRLV